MNDSRYLPSPSKGDKRYLHTLTAGAWLPMVQSGITGTLVLVVLVVLGYYWRWRSPWTVATVIGLLAWVGSWVLLQSHWFRLTDLERLTGLDFNRDGRIGEADSLAPSPLSQTQRISLTVFEGRADGSLSGNSVSYDLPCTLEQLQELAAGLIEDGLPFAERTWCGAGLPFSVEGFRELRAELMRRGLVALVNGKDARQGYNLTVKGEDIFREVLAGLPLPAEVY
jgi:hypothetical protein